MFSKILVANRGEIAIRVMRTAREMGIGTVAVYSDVDAGSPHVLAADEAVFLGAADPAASYLNSDRIIAAAKETGAQAIHPGYGFLAENPEFARKTEAEGLVFIGPPARVMADLGNKTVARKLVSSRHVPIIPGMTTPEADLDRLLAAADEIGYPVLVKAAAGGGGKGMRVVQSSEELEEAVALAQSEALTAFGDSAIYLEKCLESPRHVEFQILADRHGNLVHLFERECSIQRRHQKIIEETPSPALDDDLRERMGAAAVAAAKAAGYVNAGTVEFLLDRTGAFYFLEVNTRLQVEHPITEMLTGLDLVRQQIRIAAGEPLPFRQQDITRRGHSIECRIYAEDPETNFLPSSGKILFARPPEGPGIRFDHAIDTGTHVPMNYDPILGKLVVWDEDRAASLERMVRSLKECVILGVKTPIEFLIDVVSSPEFKAGNTHTHFIDEHFPSWKPDQKVEDLIAMGFVAHEMVVPGTSIASETTSGKAKWPSPWHTLGFWDSAR